MCWKLISLISWNRKVSSRRVAGEVGISNRSAYHVLGALVEKGLVKLGNFDRNQDKRRYEYLLATECIREKFLLTCGFIEQKREECKLLLTQIIDFEEEAVLGPEALQGTRRVRL